MNRRERRKVKRVAKKMKKQLRLAVDSSNDVFEREIKSLQTCIDNPENKEHEILTEQLLKTNE